MTIIKTSEIRVIIIRRRNLLTMLSIIIQTILAKMLKLK